MMVIIVSLTIPSMSYTYQSRSQKETSVYEEITMDVWDDAVIHIVKFSSLTTMMVISYVSSLLLSLT